MLNLRIHPSVNIFIYPNNSSRTYRDLLRESTCGKEPVDRGLG